MRKLTMERAEESNITMGEMRPLQLAEILSNGPCRGHIVMRSSRSDFFEVMNLTDLRKDNCWCSDHPDYQLCKIEVKLLRPNDIVTLRLSNGSDGDTSDIPDPPIVDVINEVPVFPMDVIDFTKLPVGTIVVDKASGREMVLGSTSPSLFLTKPGGSDPSDIIYLISEDANFSEYLYDSMFATNKEEIIELVKHFHAESYHQAIRNITVDMEAMSVKYENEWCPGGWDEQKLDIIKRERVKPIGG